MKRLVYRFTEPVVIAVAAILMARWTWATWPDVLIDFGQQLYLPWRVSEGAVLYRDLAYYNGPFSVYFNAALFRIFGVGLWTLVIANLAIAASIFLLLRCLLRDAGGRWSTTAAGLVFVLMFAFAQLRGVGNYNFVCPYSHEMTHGVALSLVAILSVRRYPQHGRIALVVGSLALGLAFLTKSEVFLAGALTATTALGLAIRKTSVRPRDSLAPAALFAAVFLIPPAVAFLSMAFVMPLRQAFAGTLGSWVAAVNADVVGLPFFRRGMGTDNLGLSLRLLTAWGGGYTVLFGSAALLAWFIPRRFQVAAAVSLFIVVTGVLSSHRQQVDWSEAPRPLPIALGIAAAFVLPALLRRPVADESWDRASARLVLVVFGLALLAKIFFFARLAHYGFLLAMPGTLVAVAILVDWIPEFLDRHGRSGSILRAVAIAGLFVAVCSCLAIQQRWVSSKQTWVGTGPDRFLSGDRALAVNQVLADIARRVPRGETIYALPEGIMINYLARRPIRQRYTVVLPTELALYGESPILEDLQARPPNWILLVDRDMEEPGIRFFGKDFGKAIGAWVVENYRGVAQFEARGFAIMLLRQAEPR